MMGHHNRPKKWTESPRPNKLIPSQSHGCCREYHNHIHPVFSKNGRQEPRPLCTARAAVSPSRVRLRAARACSGEGFELGARRDLQDPRALSGRRSCEDQAPGPPHQVGSHPWLTRLPYFTRGSGSLLAIWRGLGVRCRTPCPHHV